METEPLRLHLKRIDSKGSTIIIIARQEKTNRRFTVQIPFRPYFYILASEELRARKRGYEYEPGLTTMPQGLETEGQPTLRVFADDPRDVPRMRNGFTLTFEADIPYTRRFMIDSGIRSGFIVHKYTMFGEIVVAQPSDIEPDDEIRSRDRVLHYDIEVLKPKGERKWSPPFHARGQVSAITGHDNFSRSFETFIWHPDCKKDRVEDRMRYSYAFDAVVPWRRYWFTKERDMLMAWMAYLRNVQPDIWNAWNGHHGWHKIHNGGYDVPYLITRADRIGIGATGYSPLGRAIAIPARKDPFEPDNPDKKRPPIVKVDGVQLVDMMTTYQIKDGGFVAQVPFSGLKEVVEAKTDMPIRKDPTELDRWWLEETEEFLEYSHQDVDAMVLLENTQGYVAWARYMQAFIGSEDTDLLFKPSTMVGLLELRTAREQGECLPTAKSEGKEKAKGGFVLPPRVTGITPRVGVLDLDAMYVHILLSGNISYETWVENPRDEDLDKLICLPSDMGPQYFVRPEHRVGLQPKVANILRELRASFDVKIKAATSATEIERLKKARDPAKQLLLATWGSMLNRFNRMFRAPCGSSVTGTGRFIITGCDDHLQQRDTIVAYQDTDSLFVPLPEEDPVGTGLAHAESLNKHFDVLAAQMNMTRHSFHIGMETLFDPLIQGNEKKTYAGLVTWAEGRWMDEPDFIVKGIQGKKSDAAPVTKEIQYATLRALLSDARPVDVMDNVRMLFEAVSDGQMPVPDVIRAVKLSSDVEDEEPESVPPALRAALNGREMFGFDYPVGGKVRVVYLKGLTNKTVAIPEGQDIPDKLHIDWKRHAETTVLKPVMGVLKWVKMEDLAQSIRFGSTATVQARM